MMQDLGDSIRGLVGSGRDPLSGYGLPVCEGCESAKCPHWKLTQKPIESLGKQHQGCFRHRETRDQLIVAS